MLFVENIYNLLKMGGTAGVIVPQGVLFGSGNAFVEAKKILVDKCELKAVITMPSGVFKPYAGVSTAILIFTKGGETENVWFYDMQSDGYSLDDKRAKLEGYGDLQDIVEQFKKRDQNKESDRKEKFFFVPKAQIVAEARLPKLHLLYGDTEIKWMIGDSNYTGKVGGIIGNTSFGWRFRDVYLSEGVKVKSGSDLKFRVDEVKGLDKPKLTVILHTDAQHSSDYDATSNTIKLPENPGIYIFEFTSNWGKGDNNVGYWCKVVVE